LDEFKKTLYVPRGVDVSSKNKKLAAQWNWVKQPT